VTLNNKWSRWRRQRNGLPQGSVLAPILFNLYTNDQSIPNNTKHFLYADDLAIIAQVTSFEKVQDKLVNTLESMNEYYNKNQLKPNPNKTQVCCFHLRNRDAKKRIDIKWIGNTLPYTDYPVYLGVTLDRTLTFKEHCIRTIYSFIFLKTYFA